MATLYKKGAGNFDGANGWNSLANGTGTDYTATDSGGGNYIVGSASNTLDLNNVACTLNQSVTAALIQASTSNGYLDVSGTQTINANITYSSTSTSGMVRVSTGDALTINGQVTQSGGGYAIVTSGSGTLVISNAGGTAISVSNGRGVQHTSSGTVTITGGISVSAQYGVYAFTGGEGAISITGDVSCTGTVSYGIYVAAACDVTLDGAITSTAGVSVTMINGTFSWIGSRTIATGKSVYIYSVSTGVLVFATAGGALTATVSGVLIIDKRGSTLTLTSGANTASFIRQVTAAQIAVHGVDASSYITGPTIPAEADVETGVEYGYAGDLQTGTLAAGGGLLPTRRNTLIGR